MQSGTVNGTGLGRSRTCSLVSAGSTLSLCFPDAPSHTPLSRPCLRARSAKRAASSPRHAATRAGDVHGRLLLIPTLYTDHGGGWTDATASNGANGTSGEGVLPVTPQPRRRLPSVQLNSRPCARWCRRSPADPPAANHVLTPPPSSTAATLATHAVVDSAAAHLVCMVGL